MPPRTATVWIDDIAGDGAGVITDVFDLYHDETLDQTETLTLELAADHPKAPLLVADVGVRLDDRSFYVREVSRRRNGTDVIISAECEALWYRLLDTTRVGSVVLSSVTAAAGLATILDGTGWVVGGQTSASSTTFSLEEQDQTVLALVRKWAAITGLSVVWDTSSRAVNLVSSRGASSGASFRFGKNIKSGTKRIQPPLATVVYGYGADGLNFAGLNSGKQYLEDFTWYTDQGLTIDEARALYTRQRVFSDTSYLVDADLMAATAAKLALWSQPSVEYAADVVDISELTGVRERIRAGDTVTVYDPDLDLDQRTTVVRYKRFPLAPWNNEIGLAFASDPQRDGASSARPQSSSDWHQFVSNTADAKQLRNDARYVLGHIPLQFREGGQANYHVDFFATGVGAGTLTMELYDNTTASTVYRALPLAYTDGVTVHGSMSFAAEDLTGTHDYVARYSTVASGGPGAALGVNFAAGEARFYIMALGAVQQTPTVTNSQRFDYVGALQTFTVPDDVFEITIEAHGSQGGSETGVSVGGSGGKVTATFPVVAGQVLNVGAGFPLNGGGGGFNSGSSSSASAGGASSYVSASTFANALIVAAGGGGAGESSGANNDSGGPGGYIVGGNGLAASSNLRGVAQGATQTAGGAGGTGPDGPSAGFPGTFGQGGAGRNIANAFAFAPGGGGGGWYGGGGAYGELSSGFHPGGGGGGSGWVDPTGTDISNTDGENAAAGYVIISWETPA